MNCAHFFHLLELQFPCFKVAWKWIRSPSSAKEKRKENNLHFSSRERRKKRSMMENGRKQLESSTDLPEDLIFMFILPRLSYKSLSKFKCVSKAWYEAICKDTKFAQSQSLCPSPISCGMVLSLCYNNDFQIFNTFDCTIGLNPDYLQHLRDSNFYCTRILSSSCGLLCIAAQMFDEVKATKCLYICNLAVGAGNIIPLNGHKEHNIALAFDPSMEPDCFKLVKPLWGSFPSHAGILSCYMFNVYSSRTCEWAQSKTTLKGMIKGSSSSLLSAKPITLKSVVYWDYHEYVIYFNPWKEVAGYITLPEHGASLYNQELGSCNGRITCTRTDPTGMQVYVLTDESAGKKIWEMKHKVDLYVFICAYPGLVMELRQAKGTKWVPKFEPFPYEGGSVLFFKVSTMGAELVFSYDLKAGRVAKFCEFYCSRVLIADRAHRRVFSYHNSMAKVPELCRARNHC